jgi:hypothetical protein
MTGSEEHLAHYVPDEDDEDIPDKINKLNKFTENAKFASDSKGGIRICSLCLRDLPILLVTNTYA